MEQNQKGCFIFSVLTFFLLQISTAEAAVKITEAQKGSYIFTNAKDGKNTIICEYGDFGQITSGYGTYNKKKKTWNWKSYISDLRNVVKPGKIPSAKQFKKIIAIRNKLDAAEASCRTQEKTRIIGSWTRSTNCANRPERPCLENYTYSFSPDGYFSMHMEGNVTCYGEGPASTSALLPGFPITPGYTTFYVQGRYIYDATDIVYYPEVFVSYHPNCGAQKERHNELQMFGGFRRSAKVSLDGNYLNSDLYCPDSFHEKTMFNCETETAPNFVRIPYDF